MAAKHRRRRARLILGAGPAWTVVSLVTVVLLFFVMEPAAAVASPPPRLPSVGGLDMIEAPIVLVDGTKLLVDGAEVASDELRDALRKKHDQYTWYRHKPIDPTEEVIIYEMAPNTPASTFIAVNDAARAAGFTQPYFMRGVYFGETKIGQ